ncbi:hypothetical protein [Anaerotignum sp.]|uniref:hypothetical protein n=1 Tax=Anaerotignum sp. TaxID=2039241 RepID=UPI00289FC455|nr:hypothetical protein [Anaerotignum sp.]
MAFIYRYQLRDVNLRNNTSLVNYNQEIQTVLEKHFKKNLKDNIVEDRYFEFKLYSTVHRGVLQEMGRMLKANLPININKYGFVRMEQTLYAFVYSSQSVSIDNDLNDIAYIELIDSSILDQQESFMRRANNFFEKTSDGGLQSEKSYIGNSESLIKNFYIDILDVYINKQNKHSLPILLNGTDELRCFFIKGFHRHIANRYSFNKDQSFNDLLKIERCFDIGFIVNQDANLNIKDDRMDHLDYLKIHVLEEHPELVEKIKNELELYISPAEKIEALNNINNMTGKANRCVFKTHEVGQALASSLSYENDPPFLYFDYGMPYGENSFTRPENVNMPTSTGITIILSHVDKDHWFRIADDINAYKCFWYIPNQQRGTQLNHKLAEIIARGGTVQTINSDLLFPIGKITCGGQSKLKPLRAAKHVHETGLTLRIQGKNSQGEELNILMAGDQRYDYVEINQMQDLDILVASHHGGTFCWSTKGAVPIAKNKMNSVAIYSYGLDNTHGHPSKLSEYRNANWLKEHHTCKNGEFSITLFL